VTRRALVRVPASASNLGAGFDCVGVAVNRWLTLSATINPHSPDAPPTLEYAGTLAGLTTNPADDRIVAGARAACALAGRQLPGGLALSANSEIPVSRGLGSSAAAAVAGAVAIDALLHLRLGDHALAAAAASVEGHPDNVAAAIWGGAVLVLEGAGRDGGLMATSIRVAPSLTLVLAVPDFAIETAAARAALPPSLPHATATRAAALGIALVQGLANADAPLLALAMQEDVLHLPYRRALVKGYDQVVSAAVHAGAHAATLSGSGPTILALAPNTVAAAVAEAMCAAWSEMDVTANCFATQLSTRGFTLSVREGEPA